SPADGHKRRSEIRGIRHVPPTALPQNYIISAEEATAAFGPRLPVWHVCFHGEFWRVTGRGMEAKKTTRLTLSRTRYLPTSRINRSPLTNLPVPCPRP